MLDNDQQVWEEAQAENFGAPIYAAAQATKFVSWDGERTWAGMGALLGDHTDYETLRARSVECFRRNPYGRGIIRRLLDNEVSTGLELEVQILADMMGVTPEEAKAFSSKVETRFGLWAESRLPDALDLRNFFELTHAVREEALIGGDCLVVLDVSSWGLPLIRLFPAEAVKDPRQKPSLPQGETLTQGVHLSSGKHIGYWVSDGKKDTYIPRHGKSGRLQAWLVYGTDRRYADVRGEPVLGLLLQALKNLGETREASVLKEKLAAKLAIFVERNQPVMASAPPMGAGKALSTVESAHPAPSTGGYVELSDGIILQNLQPGESPKAFQSATSNLDFPAYEAGIICVCAWAVGIPPEILQLSYGKSFSASTNAIKEFKTYLELVRYQLGRQFCAPIYHEWLLGEVLSGRIEADKLLEARLDRGDYAVYQAWTSSVWNGPAKGSADILKEIKSVELGISLGMITHEQAARDICGTSFWSNVEKLKEENRKLAEANEPLKERAVTTNPLIESQPLEGEDDEDDPTPDPKEEDDK